jgi:hypothetical protein
LAPPADSTEAVARIGWGFAEVGLLSNDEAAWLADTLDSDRREWPSPKD